MNFDQKAENNLDSGGVDRKEGERFLEGECPVHVWQLPPTWFDDIPFFHILEIVHFDTSNDALSMYENVFILARYSTFA